MAELPLNWIECELEKVVKLSSGGTPKSSNKKYYEGGTIPWLIIADLNDGYIEKAKTNITELGLRESSAKIVPFGAILIAMYGSIGKLGIANISCATNQAIAFTEKIDLNLDNKFLFYYLFSIKSYLASLGKGGAQQNISQTVLKKIPILLPPLNEQKRIVEKLDKMMKIVDGVNARLDKIPTALKRARQSILNQAITGELTKDWREKNLNIIPASIMIEKFKQSLLESSSKNEKDKINNIFSFKENYFSFDIPHTWTFSILEKLSKSFKYGTSTKSESSGLVPVLRMGNIQKGEIDWNDLVYTSDSKEIEKYKLEKNDVLFNRTNSPELVGKTAIYRGERAAIYAGYLIKIENYKILNSEYLNYALNSTFAKEWKLDVKTDGVSQSNINAQKLAKFEVPLPPLEEQAEIVRRVKLAFEKLDKIELRYQKAKEYSDKLTQSILNKAFRGELVPQDPNDSPIKIPE